MNKKLAEKVNDLLEENDLVICKKETFLQRLHEIQKNNPLLNVFECVVETANQLEVDVTVAAGFLNSDIKNRIREELSGLNVVSKTAKFKNERTGKKKKVSSKTT